MSAVDYVITVAVAVVAGAILGPPVGFWLLYWQHRVSRHRAQCAECRCDEARWVEREAVRHGAQRVRVPQVPVPESPVPVTGECRDVSRSLDHIVGPELVGMVARSMTKRPISGPTPEEVDTVVRLRAVVSTIQEHNEHVMTGNRCDWAALADHLVETARACDQQVILDVGDPGAR